MKFRLHDFVFSEVEDAAAEIEEVDRSARKQRLDDADGVGGDPDEVVIRGGDEDELGRRLTPTKVGQRKSESRQRRRLLVQRQLGDHRRNRNVGTITILFDQRRRRLGVCAVQLRHRL